MEKTFVIVRYKFSNTYKLFFKTKGTFKYMVDPKTNA